MEEQRLREETDEKHLRRKARKAVRYAQHRANAPKVNVTERWARFGTASVTVPHEHEGFVRMALEGARAKARSRMTSAGVLRGELTRAGAGEASRDRSLDSPSGDAAGNQHHRVEGGGDGHWAWETGPSSG